MNELPLISVIVPTKNSEKTLEKCLRSVKNQTYNNIEIIVVDNYSQDRTRKIAEKFGALVFLKSPERCTQVNLGARKAMGKYVYIIGSDFVLEPSVVEKAVRKSEGGCDAVIIHNTSDPSISFWAKVRKLERDCVEGDDLNVAARFFKKTVFEKLEGYDEDLIAAEDYDLHNRLIDKGFKLGTINSQEIHIGEPRTLADIVRKHYYYGKSIKKFVEKNQRKGLKQLSPIRPAYIRNWKVFAKNPLLTIGFIIYQICRYVSACVGLLSPMEMETSRVNKWTPRQVESIDGKDKIFNKTSGS